VWLSPDDMWAMQQLLQQEQRLQWGGLKGKAIGKGNWSKGAGWLLAHQTCTRALAADPQRLAQLAADLNCRGRLNKAMQKKFKDWVADKEKLEYTMVEEGTAPPTYICEIRSDTGKLSQAYLSDGPAFSKKQAAENAAMIALEGEFPELFQLVPQAIKDLASDLQGQRQKAAGAGPGSGDNNDAKSLLSTGIKKIAGRPILKEELVYVVKEKGDSCQATVTINCEGLDVSPKIPKTFTGIVVPGMSKVDKKRAEQHAAEKALKALQAEIDKKRPEHEGKKKDTEKGIANDSAGKDPKSKLSEGVIIMVGRPIAKGEIAYVVEATADRCQATVTISCEEVDTTPKTFTGKNVRGMSKVDKKQAEQHAAEKALKAFQAEIEEKRPAHEARKAENQALHEAKGVELRAARAAAEAAGEVAEPPKKVQKLLRKSTKK